MATEKPNILVIWGDDIGITNLFSTSDRVSHIMNPDTFSAFDRKGKPVGLVHDARLSHRVFPRHRRVRSSRSARLRAGRSWR